MVRQSTAIEVEGLERAALEDLHAAASPALRARLGLALQDVDGTLVSSARHAPTILVNRALGLGMSQPATPESVRTIVSCFAAAGISRYFVHLDPAARPAGLPQWLREAGLEPYRRGWAKFLRDDAPAKPARTELDVRLIDRRQAADFGRVAAEAFDLPDPWAAVVAELVGGDGWYVYMSFADDEPAGCGAMRIVGDGAWFDWGATRRAFRARGSQSAIFAARIEQARALGCRLLATTTGEAVPGDPQHSYNNILRAGFRVSHVRANWVPAQ